MRRLNAVGDDKLMLLEDAAGLELIVVCRRRGAGDGVSGGIEGGRSDVVGEILMDTLSVELSDVCRNCP
jgi:hypothetical protein